MLLSLECLTKKAGNHQYNALSISRGGISPNTHSKRIKVSPQERDMKRRHWAEVVTKPTKKSIQWPYLDVAIYTAIEVTVLKVYSCKYVYCRMHLHCKSKWKCYISMHVIAKRHVTKFHSHMTELPYASYHNGTSIKNPSKRDIQIITIFIRYWGQRITDIVPPHLLENKRTKLRVAVVVITMIKFCDVNMFVGVHLDAMATGEDKLSSPAVYRIQGSLESNRQQTECPLTNWLSYRGSSC